MSKLRHKLKPEDEDEIFEDALTQAAAATVTSSGEITPFVSEPSKDLGKVAVNDQTPRCPFCKSTLIAPVAAASGLNAFANMRCSNCRKQFRLGPQRVEKTA